jgi:hypothetical protein
MTGMGNKVQQAIRLTLHCQAMKMMFFLVQSAGHQLQAKNQNSIMQIIPKSRLFVITAIKKDRGRKKWERFLTQNEKFKTCK